MAIGQKTRKTLWARSGNSCALCRIELVAERNEHNRNLNIGDECHIISSKSNGPRHIANFKNDYDNYDNLILLCKNHHKTIDELWETYTSELLIAVKNNHENWVKTVIDNAKNQGKKNIPVILKRLKSGKEIVDIVIEADAYQFDHDEFKSKEAADFVSTTLQNIQDLGEVSSFQSFQIGEQIEIGFDLNKEIEKLETRGFYIFGKRRRARIFDANKKDFGIVEIATFVVFYKENPRIENSESIKILLQ
jgi:hypothetical protein